MVQNKITTTRLDKSWVKPNIKSIKRSYIVGDVIDPYFFDNGIRKDNTSMSYSSMKSGGLSSFLRLKKDHIKKFALTDEAKHAFEEMNRSLSSAPVLSNPDFNKHFYIQCDASTQGVGGFLFQIDDEENEHPIAFMSTQLNKAHNSIRLILVLLSLSVMLRY